jgi:hypothetical protein
MIAIATLDKISLKIIKSIIDNDKPTVYEGVEYVSCIL